MAHETYLLARFIRCWNDQPLSSRRSTTPPADTSDSVNKALAFDLSAPRPKAKKTEVFYPSIIVNNSVSTDLLSARR